MSDCLEHNKSGSIWFEENLLLEKFFSSADEKFKTYSLLQSCLGIEINKYKYVSQK